MNCPFCSHNDSRVVDSRPADDGSSIRRRRECSSCGRRFTTYEVIETIPVMVVKRDQTRQPFNREKLLEGILRACARRPVSSDTMEAIVSRIEQSIYNTMQREIPTQRLGEMVMDELKAVDEVAYVRFASVYRDFSDVDSFLRELKMLMDEKN